MDQAALRISPYVAENRDALMRFYEGTWTPPPFKKNPAWLDWSILGNPYNRPDQTPLLVAWHGDAIVGQFLFIPTELWVDGQPRTAAWARDLFVSPEFRRNKLALNFFKKGKELYGIILTSGYSEGTRRMQNKYGWTQIRPVCNNEMLLTSGDYLRHTLVNEPSKIIKRVAAMIYGNILSRKIKRMESSVSIAEAFEPNDYSIWEKNKTKYNHICSRSFDFLSWRINKHPYYSYIIFKTFDNDATLSGYLIARKDNDAIFIIDIFVNYNYETIVDGLLAALIDYSKKNKFIRIIFRSASIMLEASAKKCGFLKTTLHQDVRMFADAFGDGGTAWYVTAIDSDQDR